MEPQFPDKTTAAVSRQIAAMAAEVYEVGVFDARAEQSKMLLRVWDVNSLQRSIPWLRHENRDGRNIYVRPGGEHNLSLVDDLKREQIEAMKAGGYQPALVVETSPGNFQAWLKHPETLSREASTTAARLLAEKFDGDKGSADWRHFGRLSGFTNRKPKYEDPATGLYPFCKLTEATGAEYSQGPEFMGEVRDAVAEQARRAIELRPRAAGRNGVAAEIVTKTIDQFRSDPRYGNDATRSDLAYAVYAVTNGISEADARANLASRDLSHKGNEKRQAEYLDRTIRKAVARGVGR
jgi:hypothetical protein